jgi:ATP-dependent protease ClpP protease subunit
VTLARLQQQDFKSPAVVLSGPVDQAMYSSFRDQLNNCPEDGLCIVELSTLGGDPEVARLMGEDVRYNSDLNPKRRIVFLGKAAVYSAGTTFMSFFARQNRYLTRGTRLMIHERIMSCSVELNGPLTTCIASVKAKLNELEASIAIQNEGFASLVLGSKVTLEEVQRRAPENWYVDANEAADLGLIEAVI